MGIETGSITVRGRFGARLDRLRPGLVRLGDGGEFEIQVFGEDENLHDDDDNGKDRPPLYGELEKSEIAGACVVFRRALRTSRRFGSGGSSEVWSATNMVAGRDFVEESDLFDRVVVSADGLSDFLSRPKKSVPEALEVPEVPAGGDAASAVIKGIGKVIARWAVVGSWNDTHIDVSTEAVVDAELVEGHQLNSAIEQILNPTRALLFAATRRFVGVSSISVWNSSRPHVRYRVYGTQLEGVRGRRSRRLELSRLDFLFTQQDIDWGMVFDAARQLAVEAPDFSAQFFSSERAPAPYVEERFRATFAAFAYLTPVIQSRGYIVPTASETTKPASWHTVSAVFGELPATAQTLLQEAFTQEALLPTIDSTRFADALKGAYEWTSFRRGEKRSGIELLELTATMRNLIHLVLLRFVGGFEHDDSSERLRRAVGMRGWF